MTAEPWTSRTLAQVLARAAAQWPDAEALIASALETGDARLSFAELAARVRATAAGLAQLGVARGDRVAICMGNSVEWAVSFYAAALLGAITVPVNTRFKEGELTYCLSQAGVSTLITADRFLKIDFVAMLRSIEPAIDRALPGTALPALRRLVVLGDDVPATAVRFDSLGETAAAEPPPPHPPPQAGEGVGQAHSSSPSPACGGGSGWGPGRGDDVSEDVRPDDVVIMQYTSGTTSFPKGVLLTHDNVLHNAEAVAQRLGVRAGDRYFSARPFYHVAGTTLSLLVALSAGACLITTPSFDAGSSLAIMARERCTLVSGNDTMFLMMMAHPDFAHTRLALRGGWAAAGPVVMRQAIERMGLAELCFAYGLSEASPNVVMSDHRDEPALRIAGLARPHDGVAIRIADPETGAVLAQEQVGEILVRGWNVMRGYHDKPAESAQALAGSWLHTGDLGALTADGRLRFVGRVKDVFRVGGENVAPAEVEEVLHDHPAVAQAQVIGVPDPRLGEVPAAYVRLREGGSAAPDELIAWCRARCANFKVPRYVRIVASFDDIGMTGSSKVQKEKLRRFALADLGIG